MISVGVRLAAFNLKEIANLTCTDELDLASIGEKKVALFCCIPDADTSLNYLVGMIYSNLFQTLYYVADRKYGGRLPVPVHCIMDEWPNVALPDDFDKILATMRSRAISCSIIIQNMAQMKPEYISQEVLDKEQMDEVKDVESWTVDQTDGSMYFFLDDKIGWRLVVADAAAGSRFYQLEKTADGGDTWEMANQNPFGGNLGVTEGLEFFDKNFGFAGLTGASQSHSSLYVTRDGGTTFTELQLPLETVTELPPLAKELNFTIENYKYCEMPKKKEDILTIKLLTGAGEIQGIRFESKDNGETWAYAGISVE